MIAITPPVVVVTSRKLSIVLQLHNPREDHHGRMPRIILQLLNRRQRRSRSEAHRPTLAVGEERMARSEALHHPPTSRPAQRPAEDQAAASREGVRRSIFHSVPSTRPALPSTPRPSGCQNIGITSQPNGRSESANTQERLTSHSAPASWDTTKVTDLSTAHQPTRIGERTPQGFAFFSTISAVQIPIVGVQIITKGALRTRRGASKLRKPQTPVRLLHNLPHRATRSRTTGGHIENSPPGDRTSSPILLKQLLPFDYLGSTKRPSHGPGL